MIQIVFICITFLSLVLFYFGTGMNKRILFASIIWLLLIGIISYSGFFENTNTTPPRFLLVLLTGIALSVYFYKNIEPEKIHPAVLLGIHALRLPVELMLYELFLKKEVPILMTFKGWNYDILMGISALVILTYTLIFKQPLNHTFMRFWNGAGLILLMAIVTIAILSSPLPIQQFAFDQPNVAVLKFPVIFLPAYIVPVVFLAHILALQKLKSIRSHNQEIQRIV